MDETPPVRFPAGRLALAMAIIGTKAGLDPITTVFWRCVFATAFLHDKWRFRKDKDSHNLPNLRILGKLRSEHHEAIHLF